MRLDSLTGGGPSSRSLRFDEGRLRLGSRTRRSDLRPSSSRIGQEGKGVKAMRLHSTGPAFALREEVLPDPTPGPGEVLLSVEACGICRTDLHIAEGEVPA